MSQREQDRRARAAKALRTNLARRKAAGRAAEPPRPLDDSAVNAPPKGDEDA